MSIYQNTPTRCFYFMPKLLYDTYETYIINNTERVVFYSLGSDTWFRVPSKQFAKITSIDNVVPCTDAVHVLITKTGKGYILECVR